MKQAFYKKAITIAVLTALGTTMVGCSGNQTKPSITALPESKVVIEKTGDPVIDSAPEWMYKIPSKEKVLYASSTAKSRDMEMSKEKAISQAQGYIAEAVGGKVSKVTKIYRTDAGETSTENSSTAIKKFVKGIDFTGTEIVELKIVPELNKDGERNGWYRTYVLVGLPLGEENIMLRQQIQDELARKAMENQNNTFKEIDSETSADVTIVPLVN